jgi:anthraniloyl-CoA monooxygenase
MRIVCVGAGPAGLYFGILSKLRDPGAAVEVLERNPQGVTYGWGVTLCDSLLDTLYATDPVSATQIQHNVVRWRDQIAVLGGRAAAYVGSYGFAMGRHRLLEILAERATELGVDVRYQCAVSAGAADEFADADLVLAADGVQSQLRRQFADEFGTTIKHGRNHYAWLGTTKEFSEFTYAFEETQAGWIWFYAYPFDSERSTVIAECAPSTWQGLGFDRLNPDETLGELERIFERHLDGHPLLLQVKQDSAPWLNFSWISNRSWVHRNVTLAGDAAHTAHFSIGAGTKLAIDDVVALNRQLQAHGGTPRSVAAALDAYQRERIDAVAAQQRIARNSADWFERVEADTGLSPARFSYVLGTTRYSNDLAPTGLPWVKHLAAQLGVGRHTLSIVNDVRRRRRARQRDPERMPSHPIRHA